MVNKVVILTPFYSPVKGGITTFVQNLSRFLENEQISVLLITREGEAQNKVEVLRSGKYRSMVKLIISLTRKKCDVLHSHSHWYFMVPCIWYKLLYPKTILVHTFHTQLLDPPKGLKKRIFEWLVSRYDFISYVSHNMKNTFESDFNIKTKGGVIYAGVTVDEPTDPERKRFIEEYDLKGHYPILAFVGPFSWKMKVEGIKRLVASVKDVKKEFPEVKLVLTGGGMFKKDLKTIAEDLKIADNVVFTGFLDKSSIPLSVADIYCHISFQEGLSISVLEAMYLGKPVISSKIGGLSEIISHDETGMLTEPDSETIAHDIVALAKDREKMQILGKNGQRMVVEHHNWENVVQRFLDIYNEK